MKYIPLYKVLHCRSLLLFVPSTIVGTRMCIYKVLVVTEFSYNIFSVELESYEKLKNSYEILKKLMIVIQTTN
jgi:hypothetical protein